MEVETLSPQSEAHSPHVYLRGVFRGAQQNVRRPIPKRHHLVGVRLSGHGLGPCQACVEHVKKKLKSEQPHR